MHSTNIQYFTNISFIVILYKEIPNLFPSIKKKKMNRYFAAICAMTFHLFQNFPSILELFLFSVH